MSIIVALDAKSQYDALTIAEQLDPELCRVKVGKELFTHEGPSVVKALQDKGFEVFLDLKFHDIPNTTAQAVCAAADLGVWMVNVHASGGRKMMETCVERLKAGNYNTQLIAVTVLTSMGREDLKDIGLDIEPFEHVKRLAALTQDSGLDGVVCSAQEAKMLRETLGADFALVTPAIADLAFASFTPDLLITVDNGISSHDGVKQAQDHGMQVIITDHHLTTKPTPAAEAVVNPNQLGCEFPSKALAGVGVAFYVLANLSTHRKKLGKSSTVITNYLDLVALGTYADVASLDYNNRILVDAGLKRIQQHLCRPGISALLEIAGRDAATLKAQDLGFVLGPRINAAGRMETMDIGIECLLAKDLATAYPLAEQLNQLNVERRQVEGKIKQEALAELEKIQLDETELPEQQKISDAFFNEKLIPNTINAKTSDLYNTQ